MPENFYIILGISRDADPAQIRSAYRRLVRELHPDISEDPPERFIELQRAYETLSDPEMRREYDARLRGTGAPVPVNAHPEPRRARVARGRRRPHRFAGMGRLHSTVDELFGGFVPGFFNTGRQSSRAKDLYVEMILSPNEAGRGGLYPLKVPVVQPCPDCGGTGARGQLACPSCRGGVLDYREVHIAVPAGVVDGQRAQLSLEDVGVPGVNLHVLVSVR